MGGIRTIYSLSQNLSGQALFSPILMFPRACAPSTNTVILISLSRRVFGHSREQQCTSDYARPPLLLQLRTADPRRYSSRAGPTLWLVKRIKEVLLWREGWKYTATFISAYAAICLFLSCQMRHIHL
ncbi:hypothetical protein BS47DRAFT_160274 [Hydnum rufescens UP504]|uniref:Uncharacterized protein n=1 Tax=Hydnum rufescens UP504 TaxID=1448309 RepID=A0A9P6APL2_9AGAM|nr:hypothetical protein BS47DRAFT_160274 [Hydnum rufescens UP504]